MIHGACLEAKSTLRRSAFFESAAFNSVVWIYREVNQLKTEAGQYVLYTRISLFFPTLAGGGREEDFFPDHSQPVHKRQ